MITIKTLNELWQSIVPQSGNTIGRRADIQHPLDFFISYDENNNMQLMLISKVLVDMPNSSQEITVRQKKRADGRYALCFTLNSNALRDMFVALCWDMMDCTVNTTHEQSGVNNAVKRFLMWQRLFSVKSNKSMSDEEFCGLIGELCTLKSVCAPLYGFDCSVTAWVGPVYSDRDFEFDDCWYESKAISFSKDVVSISSFDQLDYSKNGILVICRMEKTSSFAEESMTIKELIDEIYAQITEIHTKTLFSNRLLLSGYSETDSRAEDSYSVHEFELYRVDASFPKIVRSNLPTAISNGKYVINIHAIQSWRI